MRLVRCRGGFGYGDTLNAITYSHSCTIRYDTPVRMVIHWPFSEDYRHSPQDPETVLERFNYILSTMAEGKHPVIFDHIFLNKKPHFRWFNNPDHNNPLHGVWYTKQCQTTTKKVVVWSSRHNVEPVGQYKDPFVEQVDELIEWLSNQGYQAVEITYRTPVREVIHHINECCMGIGYDGMVHQLFKYLWKPVVVIGERVNLNQLLVPQATIVKSVDDIYRYGLDILLKECESIMRRVKKAHHIYLYEDTIIY